VANEVVVFADILFFSRRIQYTEISNNGKVQISINIFICGIVVGACDFHDFWVSIAEKQGCDNGGEHGHVN
jgi:hypothetical protein